MSPALADRFFTAGPHGKPIKWNRCSHLGIFSQFTLDDLFNLSPRDAQPTSFKIGFKLSSEELNHYFCYSEAVISKMVNWWMLCIWGTTLKHINRNKTSNSESVPVHWRTPWTTVWARSEHPSSLWQFRHCAYSVVMTGRDGQSVLDLKHMLKKTRGFT